MDTVKFGIIGLGLMGREFASAAMRWSHLTDMEVKPEIVAICDKNMNPDMERWYCDGLGTVKQVTTDYRELLANDEVEAIYCAVPHNLHARFYTDIIRAGKHLMGEKPFGIDMAANQEVQKALDAAVNKGGICFLPAGSYRLEGSLTVPAGVTLKGTYEGIPHPIHPLGYLKKPYRVQDVK